MNNENLHYNKLDYSDGQRARRWKAVIKNTLLREVVAMKVKTPIPVGRQLYFFFFLFRFVNQPILDNIKSRRKHEQKLVIHLIYLILDIISYIYIYIHICTLLCCYSVSCYVYNQQKSTYLALYI